MTAVITAVKKYEIQERIADPCIDRVSDFQSKYERKQAERNRWFNLNLTYNGICLFVL